MPKIRYIGSQPQKRASVVIEKSLAVWVGQGDVQEVTDQEAAVLLQPQYAGIWMSAEHPWEKPAPAPKPKQVIPPRKNAIPAAPVVVPASKDFVIPPRKGQAAPVEPEPVVEPVDPAVEDDDSDEDEGAGGEDQATDEVVTDEQVKERLIAIVKAIPALTESDFTPDGKPKVTSLSKALGAKVTRIERDAAWDAVKAGSGVPDAAADTGQAPE